MSDRPSAPLTRLLLAATLASVVACSDSCHEHLKYGAPGAADETLCREGYAVGYSYHYRNPAWVASRLTTESLAAQPAEPPAYYHDKVVPEAYRPSNRDYYGTGFIYGRLTTNQGGETREAWEETGALSNTSPMLRRFRRQLWSAVDAHERELVALHGELHTVTGPLFEGLNRDIGEHRIAIPSHFYKVYYAPRTGEMSALVVPHEQKPRQQLDLYAISVDEVEQRSGLDFFHKVLNVDEDALEAASPVD